MVREVYLARNRLDSARGHLKIARGEAFDANRAPIGNFVLVELVANQARQVGFERHWESSSVALHYDSRGRMVMQVAVRVPPNAPAITRSSWLAFSTPPTSSAPVRRTRHHRLRQWAEAIREGGRQRFVPNSTHHNHLLVVANRRALESRDDRTKSPSLAQRIPCDERIEVVACQEVPELGDLVGEGGRDVQVDGRAGDRPDGLPVR